MGKDIIYREDAIEALKGRENILHDAYTAVAIIRSIPSADRPRGYWFYSCSIFSRGYECTNCHKKSIAEYDYCPRCGARMKGADDE